jgi:hypothetical protein
VAQIDATLAQLGCEACPGMPGPFCTVTVAATARAPEHECRRDAKWSPARKRYECPEHTTTSADGAEG